MTKAALKTYFDSIEMFDDNKWKHLKVNKVRSAEKETITEDEYQELLKVLPMRTDAGKQVVLTFDS